MSAISQRFQNMIWFLPLDKFAIGFVLYMLVGTIALSARVDIVSAFLATFVGGVVLTSLVSAARPVRHFEREGANSKPLAWRLLFGPLRASKEDDSDPSESGAKPDGEPPSGIEDKEFRRRMRANQIDSKERATRKMHDKIITTSLVVALYLVAFWFVAENISGFFAKLFGSGGDVEARSMFGVITEISFKTHKELFLFDWWVLAIMWYILIVFFPKWLVYLMLLGVSGMRIVLLVFGPMASMWIMNIGQLPVFYGLMMLFLFGSVIYPFIQPIKFYRPGDANWGTPKGSMRGQPEVRAIVETELAKFWDYITKKSKRRPTRGMVFKGPPGTGKTLYAKEIATEFNIPFVMLDGSSLSGAPFINLIMEYYVKPRTHSYAEEYGGAVVFIDEGEILLGTRQGMTGGGPAGGMGTSRTQNKEIQDVWDLMPYDSIGSTSNCGVLYDSSQARERFWQLKSPLSLGKAEKPYAHNFFLPVGMGNGGQATTYFLTWMDGIGSPPAMATLKRRIANDILDGLFVPVKIPGTQILLRLPPAKPKNYAVLFIIATNRDFMLDPAILRPGRAGLSARFKTPDIESRKDVIIFYATKGVKEGFLRPELLEKEAVKEIAQATSGMSHAEIEATINTGYDVRGTHIKNLKRIKALLDSGIPLDQLLEQDRKYWLRNEEELKNENWDDDRADMRSLLEARYALIYGMGDPGLTTAESREQTAVHEYWGHFIILKAALGDVMQPSVISVMPRGNTLGMVSHIPVEERDPKPQRFYEGLLRVSVGAIVAERFFFGENQPSVSSDLENATRVACFMIGKAGMSPYKCSEEEWNKFKKLGETLIAVPESTAFFLNPSAQGFVDKILGNRHSREYVAVMLGQAFVDDYRLIRANMMKDYNFHKRAVANLLRLDEIGGAKIEKLWKRLDKILVVWDDLTGEQRSWWPDKIERVENYFYDLSKKSEAEEVIKL